MRGASRFFETLNGDKRDREGRPTIDTEKPVFTNRRPYMIVKYDRNNIFIDGILQVGGFYKNEKICIVYKNPQNQYFIQIYTIEVDRNGVLKSFPKKTEYGNDISYVQQKKYRREKTTDYIDKKIASGKFVLFLENTERGSDNPNITGFNVPFPDGIEIIFVKGGMTPPFYFLSWMHLPHGSGVGTYFEDVSADDTSLLKCNVCTSIATKHCSHCRIATYCSEKCWAVDDHQFKCIK